ncbi:MAG: hypothetical protein FWE35_00890 [Streptosporangiales bacterium]|nr:hypothetical protein [Streptosporangiales bacterium]
MANRWNELTAKQQHAARKLTEDLLKEGWMASTITVGEHFRAAQLWSHGGMDTETFARIVQAARAPYWDVMTIFPKPGREEEGPAAG